MNLSDLFIRRPVGTTLLAIGLFLFGAVAYNFLPVASLPSIDFATIRVAATRPGADPETMAATVAAPLERHLGEIASVTELTSTSTLGTTSIAVQFDLNRNIDAAARDVQAAINASAADLPADMPQTPFFKKSNPTAAPVLILALTSETMSTTSIYDVADTVIAQRISQIEGVAEVTVTGADQPAVRVQVNPAAVASIGIGLDDVRGAIVNANAIGPVGAFEGPSQLHTTEINNQLRSPSDYRAIVVRSANGSPVLLSSIATITQGVRNILSAAWFNDRPAVLLVVTKQANANVIDTVDRIHDVLNQLGGWIPDDLSISVVADRTATIRASVHDMQLTLLAAVALVMVVVFLFLGRIAATAAAGVTVPLSLAGTCAAMWAVGYSIDNLSLMAFVVAVGFVVDDAIVMIENMFRNLEAGSSPLRAAIDGARQIGFTVVSISISLIAAFIPLLFMSGIVGRLFREFSVTLAFAVAISTVVSLSVTPMICAHFVREAPAADRSWLGRAVDAMLSRTIRAYAFTLTVVLRHVTITLIVIGLTVALTIALYIASPKGYFPQDDTGLVVASTEASADTSFEAMSELQRHAAAVIRADPAVAGVASSIGATVFNPSINQGRLFISLKPPAERRITSAQFIQRVRPQLAATAGLRVYMVPSQDVRVGARLSKSQYQFTLWTSDINELQTWTPKVLDAVRIIPGLIDVSTDREQGGLRANVVIDRLAASRLCVSVQDIDNTLSDAFAQAQVSTVYTQRNQYRIVLEVDRRYQRDPADLSQIYVKASTSAGSSNGCAGAIASLLTTIASTGVVSPSIAANQVPLSAVARFEDSFAPLVVNHQGQFPSVTITYNLGRRVGIEEAAAAIKKAVAELRLPDSVRAEFAGDIKDFSQSIGAQPILLLAALATVYIVLGVLYESLAHPITIISTLPSAGLGALLALRIAGTELTVIAFIGIILLIGIVKKNGIMLVDFALEGERRHGLTPERAIYEACLARFRPILMTTMAALLGAVPLALAAGPGSELRRPLGITIIGGLIVSQVLTLYTTPVIYLLLDRLSRRRWVSRS